MELTWEGIPAKSPRPGVVTRRQDFQHMTVVLYEFEPHAAFPLHHHDEEQMVVLLAGSCRFTVGSAETPLLAGASLVVAGNVPHGCNAGPEGCRFLNILAPRRVGDGQITYGG